MGFPVEYLTRKTSPLLSAVDITTAQAPLLARALAGTSKDSPKYSSSAKKIGKIADIN